MSKIILLLSSVSFWSLIASAELVDLKFYGDAKKPTGLSATISWDLKQHVCRLQRVESKSPIDLKEAECKGLDDDLRTQNKELRKLNQAGFTPEKRRRFQSEHLPMSIIEVQGMRFAILKSSDQVCEVGGSSCEPSSTLPPDLLGFKVLKIMNQH